MKDWKGFTGLYVSNKNACKYLNKYKEFLGEIVIKKAKEDTCLLLIKNISWPYEDLSKVGEDDLDYLEFLHFIDEYFSSPSSRNVVPT